MAPLIQSNRVELEDQRERLLGSLGITLDEYNRKAGNSELSGAEWDVRDDLEAISFLLGEPGRSS